MKLARIKIWVSRLLVVAVIVLAGTYHFRPDLFVGFEELFDQGAVEQQEFDMNNPMSVSDDTSVTDMPSPDIGGIWTTDDGLDIPVYSGDAWVELDGNRPDFGDDVTGPSVFEYYSDLDELGRCGTAYANICQELMPTEKRESISSVTPSGWNNKKYDSDLVDGGWIYNRCHLIGFQLAGENANPRNLITGTRYVNIEGMLPFENLIVDYVHETDNHVLYRVTPVYEGDNLVADGVQLEGWSVEDAGEAICFNVFAYNVQPGIGIDYATGENWLAE